MSRRTIWENTVIKPVMALLRQGVTPEKIALSIALGITLGVFPVIGSTTLLCALAAVVFQLNLPAIQSINYLVSPLQLLLLIPFYQAGAFLFDAKPLPLSATQVIAMMSDNVWGTIVFLWDTTMRAIVVWLMVGPIAAILLRFVLTPLIRQLPFRSSVADGIE